MTVVLLTSLVTTILAPGSLAEPSKRPPVPQEKVIPHTITPFAQHQLPPDPGAGIRPATSWPAAGEADVDLTKQAPERSRPADLDTPAGGARRAGDLPVTLTAAGGTGSVRVRVADQAAARRAGITGVLVSLGSTGGNPGSAAVGVDYSSFQHAAGADFGSRLRLVRLPACVLTTPEAAECQVQTPLASRNDGSARVVSANVPVDSSKDPGSATVLAAVGASSGSQGSFEASSLAPSGSWSVTGNSGAFSWAYPITAPPVAGAGPAVELGYNSARVDGRTAATNNQPSWVGQGWDYAPGYIERTYRACAEDESLPEAQKTGDLCWAGQIVTMNLGGQSVSLVYDAVKGWHAASDNGARIQLVNDPGNGAYRGEYWEVTTTDGMRYFFGRNRGPGHADQQLTNSAWTVPVYGPRGGEPCNNAAGFAQSSCKQAWRWNLDFVEDPHGNISAYYYTPETNFYGANKETAGVEYTRGGTLNRIDYGLRIVGGSMYGQTAPGQVVFGVTERCTPSGAITCDPSQFTVENASHWPDTPVDQQCKRAAVCNNHAPSFWSTKRLSTITTQYNQGSGPVRVDSYRLNQSFPSIGDPQLRLDSIVRTGFDKAGNSIELPPVGFTSQLYANRVVGFNNHPAMPHWRLTDIATDTGSIIHVRYSAEECTSTTVPTDLSNVTKRCFPVYWNLGYNNPDAVLDYFHKYVVNQVEVQDRNTLSPTQITSYRYLGDPAWHFDDNEVVKPKYRTYGQFRGYGQVEVRTGDAGNKFDGVPDRLTLTRTTYFRGMNGDVMPGGRRREATVTNSLNEVIPDDNLFAGSVREVQTFDGDGGTALSSEITDMVTVATTATRTRPGLQPLTADVVATAKTRGMTTLADGSSRKTSTTNRHDNLGRLIASTGSGDGVPDTCSTTRYADNTGSWIRNRASEVITSQQACPPEGVTQAPILGVTRTYYDKQDTLGALPGPGVATRTELATDNANGALTFKTSAVAEHDQAGRPTAAIDALGRVTRTAYTPADGGIVAKIATTNAKGQTSTVELEPSRGRTISKTDVAGRRTEATYDQVGRLTAAWLPGRPKSDPKASVKHTYRQTTDAPPAITTQTLVDTGTTTGYTTSINLYDGLGQLRQTQSDDVSDPTGVTKRVVKDVFYDSHGWAVLSNNRYVTTGAPHPTLISVAASAVDSRTRTTFDGAGRTTKTTALRGLTATWDSQTVYSGDRTTTIPPPGGVPTTVVIDARGMNTQLMSYSSPPAIAGKSVSGGAAQTNAYQYNALGQVERMSDASGNVWTYGYDFLGRQNRLTDPDSGTRTSTYDLAGQLTSVTDARGQTLSYEYDKLGRRTAEYSGNVGTGTKLASWEYDTATNGVGSPSSSTRHTPTGNYSVAVPRYDSEGNPAAQIIRIPASETGLAGEYESTFSYTTTGLLRSAAKAAIGGLPAEDIRIEYDRYGNAKSTKGYNEYVSATAYTPYREPAQYTLGVLNSTGWLTYNRDSQTRRITQTNLSAQQAWPQIDDLSYTYDPAGNLTRITNVQGQPEAGALTRVQCFAYDGMVRLSEAWTATDNCAGAPSTSGAVTVGGPKPYWSSWNFDPTGLRTSQVKHALPGATGGNTTTNYTYPTAGERAVRPHALLGTSTSGPAGTSDTGFDYTQSGATKSRTLPGGKQTLTWNEHDRLATVTAPAGTTSYVYDADGRQLLRRDPGKHTLFLPGEEISRNTATGTVTGTRYYAHNGTMVALRVGGGAPQYMQADQHGTNQVSVSSDGFAAVRREFDPYGNPIGGAEGGSWPDSHGFLDKSHNETTGLTDVGARNYDPTTGRFMSVDPVLDPASPQQWAGYTYANNNPTTLSDPSGLEPCHANCDEMYTGKPPPANQGARPGGDAGEYDSVKPPPSYPKLPKQFTTLHQDPKIRKTILNQHYDTFSRSQNREEADQFKAAFCADYGNDPVCIPDTRTRSERVHDALDAVGLVIPVADVINAGVYFAEGDWENGLASTVGIIPVVGDAAKIGMRAKRAACSFSGDTEVVMADGSTKPIAEIDIGDQVLATDPESGKHGARTVTALMVHNDTVQDLVTDDGARVTTTEDHLFWNDTDRQWQRADQLSTGDRLLTAIGGETRVIGLRADTARVAAAHNLTVEDIHTYYVMVGREPVLVHNECVVPDYIYREGTPSPGNLKPRPSDEGMLSFRDSLSNPVEWENGVPVVPTRPVLRPGEPYIEVDTSKLPRGSVVPDHNPPGHVGVIDVDPSVVKEAVSGRGKLK